MSAMAMENDYCLGEWAVRPQRDCIERGGDSVHLKPKAMAVLCRLAQAGGETVTRSELFDTVWPGGTVSDAVLTQCVVELRHAFGDTARDPRIIETIPRIGFRLIPPVTPVEAPVEEKAEPTAAESRGEPGKLRLTLHAAALVIVFAGLWYIVDSRDLFSPPGDPQKHSLAVLPFESVSTVRDQDSFAAGLTEELITRLSQLEGLQVVSKTVSFSAERQGKTLDRIADELDVDYLLEGSVRKNERQLRITAKLTDVSGGFLLWSETFDRPLEDIIAIQEEITESVVIALAIKLDVGKYRDDPLATSSIEAYKESLKSQQAHREFTADSLLRAIHHAKRAVEIDPEYGYAWYGLASLYREAGTFKRVIAEEDWLQLSAEALDRAIALDPNPNAGIWEKVALAKLDHNWTAAQELLGPLTGREMVEDNPRNFDYGYFLYQVGRVRDATQLMEHWRRLHPTGQGTHSGLAVMYAAQERFEDAFASVESAYKSDGYSEFSALAGVIVALSANDRAQLSRWMDRVIAHSEGEGPPFWRAMKETVDDPLAALAYLRSVDSDSLAYASSIWAAWHGDVELALQAMRRSNTTFAFWIPVMAEVRGQPGFKELARDMNLLEYWREYVWPDFCKPVGEDDFECK